MNDQWTEVEGNAFDWDDEIKNDSTGFVLLPDGDYPYEIAKFERQRYDGGSKLPPCPMAVLTINVNGGDKGRATVTHRLYLHSRCEGLLCAFFESIGQRKHGDALRPRWNEVVGAKGVCHVAIHEYTSKKTGEPRQSNEISRFLPPPEPKAAPAAQGWTQGSF